MLAEIYFLRLEAMARTLDEANRFVALPDPISHPPAIALDDAKNSVSPVSLSKSASAGSASAKTVKFSQ
jgi:hypothetical protein